jgi:hypothetical protein
MRKRVLMARGSRGYAARAGAWSNRRTAHLALPTVVALGGVGHFIRVEGKRLKAEGNLPRMEMRVKVREPTVAALADGSFENCRPNLMGKSSKSRHAVSWVQGQR